MKYFILTLGCKVNQYETQAMETMLRARGFVRSEAQEADVLIVNTCAVTAESGRKSRQAVRHLQGENPEALVAVCGCFSQIEPEAVEALGADIVFGSGERGKLVETVAQLLEARGDAPVRAVDNPFRRMDFESLPAGAVEGRTRAMLKVQDGCDNFCTYCVIPYARGRVRSLPIADAAREAARLEAEGFREIVLTGIEIASYGKDLRDSSNLAALIVALAQAAPSVRWRLGSLEPRVATEAFCRMAAETGRVCRHFHLSLQSGCDATLSRMGRRYTTAEFLAAAERLRRYFPGCALTADLITGFPGETEADHAETLAFIRQCAFASMHIFPYSVRPGTKAAAMDGQLSRGEKARRAHEAQAVAAEMEAQFLQGCVGQTLPVLFEQTLPEGSRGHSDTYCLVSVPEEAPRGIVTNVKIQGVSGGMLVGKCI